MTQDDTQKASVGILPSGTKVVESGRVVGISSPGTFVDAPSDGNKYVRRNGAWVLETTTFQFPIGSIYFNITAAHVP